jgi:hypothetical protein
VTKPEPVSLSGRSTYDLSGARTDAQLYLPRYFFHRASEGSDTEEESENEDHKSEQVKEEPIDEEVPLFIPPDSPCPNLDHGGPIDLDSLPHSDWIKLEPIDAGLPPEPSDNDALQAEDGYETDKDDSIDDDNVWVDLFDAQKKLDNTQSTLKSEVRPISCSDLIIPLMTIF